MLILSLLFGASPAGAQDDDGPDGAASEDREVLLPIEADDDPDPSSGVSPTLDQWSKPDLEPAQI